MNIDNISTETIDLFEPSVGAKKKEQALADHEDHKGAAINWLREKLSSLYHDRAFGYDTTPEWGRLQGQVPIASRRAFVCADDARRIYSASRFPKEYSQNRTFFGSIFRGADWECIGLRIKSTHDANNARKIECWRFKG